MNKIKTGAFASITHESAEQHVTGAAIYVDDLPEYTDQLHAWIVYSTRVHAIIKNIDISQALNCDGVVTVVTAADIPGKNDIGGMYPGEPLLAFDKVTCYGQPIAVVAATSREKARLAAAKVMIEYQDLPAILDVDTAFEQGQFVASSHTLKIGDSQRALKNARHRLSGDLHIGGQEHFYLEGQIALAVPGEAGTVQIISSTQNPTEVQIMTARVLGCDRNIINVQCRRMGGAFGGKEAQATMFAALAALLARRSARPVKLRPSREDDMTICGKRHDFHNYFEVGFDDEGRIEGLEMKLLLRAGHLADLTTSIMDRALFHSDNCYYLPNATLSAYPCRTNTVSNTAFRGFGGPQGVLFIEAVIDEIARFLDRDPLDVRFINLYGKNERNITPYHQTVEDNIAHELISELVESSDYRRRRLEIDKFNATSRFVKKGLALSPLKFGISFTTSFLNQAGALILLYSDGSVALNHGGTEMGQGLFTKIAQIVAEEFQIEVSKIKVMATDTSKVPNTSPTAASSGTDMNGMAALNAARKIKSDLTAFAAEHFQVQPSEVCFADSKVQAGRHVVSFAELVNLAYLNRIPLFSTGYMKTPHVYYDRDKALGHPFHYFAYGACVSEVAIDTLTGEYKVLRTDILHDVGRSLNPALDLGQIEGAFVQGLGWATMEELWWDKQGVLKTIAPSTYKIPVARDLPFDLRIKLRERDNEKDTVLRSKAVGEPPFLHGIAVWLAIRDALSSLAERRKVAKISLPATSEQVLLAIENLRQ